MIYCSGCGVEIKSGALCSNCKREANKVVLDEQMKNAEAARKAKEEKEKYDKQK